MPNATLLTPNDFEWLSPKSLLANRVPIDSWAFLTRFCPVVLCYFASAALVCIPHTRSWRMALVAVVVPLAYSTANSYDTTGGDPRQQHLNQGFRNVLFVMSMRITEWSLVRKPYTRTDPSEKNVFRNALDLMFNFRGIGWTWSRGIPLPENPWRNMSPRAFMLFNVFAIIKYELLIDTCIYAVQLFGPTTIATPAGGSIYDANLPPLLRYARSTLIAYLFGLTMAYGIDALYHIMAFIAFCIPGRHRDPAQWPPVRGAPGTATSLHAMWGREWHQAFRNSFVKLGAEPASRLFGRVGGVMGGFAFSELLHAFGDWGFGHGLTFPGFFIMMGVGVVLEGLWSVLTGRKVGGRLGWAWTMGWVIWWSQLYAEDLLTKGMAGGEVIPQRFRPAKILVERFIMKTA